ncbi:MAG: indole-3-glycerol phosphate synthase TrpC [Armatimonadetes bacterium]|nr:MAG: indole-3-glycerol phosphate synthase TrpC [Armatimonadota bacterium]
MSVLESILREKRAEVARLRQETPWDELESELALAAPPRDFMDALTNPHRPIALIAEIKAKSPSAGQIREHLDPAEIARQYELAQADCLSVLTDGPHFGGSKENLLKARAACSLPVLRKDFIVDDYQVLESRAMGADAILLIVAALPEIELARLHGLARSMGMAVLVEAHTEEEVEAALRIGASLIGINNRDLSTFHVDLAVSERLVPRIGALALAISESGFQTHQDVIRAAGAGAKGVLIGSAFCSSPDVRSKVIEVMGA